MLELISSLFWTKNWVKKSWKGHPWKTIFKCKKWYRKPYNKQRNYVVSLLRNDKMNFYSNLDTKLVTVNTVFRKTVKLTWCLYDEIATYFEIMFYRYQCGFRTCYRAQHCLLAMIEKWKKIVDDGGVFGALLTHLSKTFDCFLYDRVIAKL